MLIDVILGLIIFLSTFIPVSVLVKQYYQTKLSDLLLIMGFFLIGGLVQLANIMAGLTNQLIYFKIWFLGFNLTFFFLFVYAIRIKWDFKNDLSGKSFRLVSIIGVIWFIILEVMVLFWQTFPQPDSITLFSLNIAHVDRSIPYPYGAGLKINNMIIYASGYDFLSQFFAAYVSLTAIYAYGSIEDLSLARGMKKARNLWVISHSFLLLFSIVTLPFFQMSLNFARTILIIGTVITVYFSIWMPEGMLISKAQILRAVHLYEIAENMKQKSAESEVKLETLYEYILLVHQNLNLSNGD